MKKLKDLLAAMSGKFNELKQTRIEMLKSFVFRPAANQLEPVEALAGHQQEFNELVFNELVALRKLVEVDHG